MVLKDAILVTGKGDVRRGKHIEGPSGMSSEG